MNILGIDIGGTKIKSAIVDTDSGSIVSEIYKVETPSNSRPKYIIPILENILNHFKNDLIFQMIGIGFPASIVKHQIISINNLSLKWIGKPITAYLKDKLNIQCHVINDADAAGLAEITFGEESCKSGNVIFLTLGSGIGSALFFNGMISPNTEFGALKINNRIADDWVSNNARVTENLSWQEYGNRLNIYLNHIKELLSPDQIILGGGVSNELPKFIDYLPQDLNIRAAFRKNGNGIIGAALAVDIQHAQYKKQIVEDTGIEPATF